MRAGPVAREVDAWGPVVERMASSYTAERRGLITPAEAKSLRLHLRFLLLNTPVK